MSNGNSRFSEILTINRVLGALVLFLAGAAGVLALRYIDGYIPKMIESEVSKQLQTQVKIQLGDEIRSSLASEFEKNNKELVSKIDQNNKELNDKIIGIYQTVSAKPQTLVPALRRGTRPRRNHHALMRTLPVSREYLLYARAKAFSRPNQIPKLTQEDFNELTDNLLVTYRNPELIHELWETLLELASFKTVINGIEFGFSRLLLNYDAVVLLNDRELKNDVLVNKIINLGNCGVVLENVKFVNCKFEVERGTNGEKLLKTLLTSSKPAISVRLTSPPGYVKSACVK